MRSKRKNKKDKRMTGFLGMMILVAILCGIVMYASAGIRKERDEKLARKQELENKLAVLQEESVRLDLRRDYTGTRRFVEEMARKVLGLVYPDDIVFEENDEAD